MKTLHALTKANIPIVVRYCQQIQTLQNHTNEFLWDGKGLYAKYSRGGIALVDDMFDDGYWTARAKEERGRGIDLNIYTRPITIVPRGSV